MAHSAAVIDREARSAAVIKEPLASGWQVCATPPGALRGPDGADGPERIDRAEVAWLPAAVPSTAAAALRAAGAWSLDGPARRFDAEDWWWRTRFPGGQRADEIALCFDGLATVAEVWLNGVQLLSSTNMFVAHQHAVELAGDNELVIRCRALDALLAARRPRPRWRAPMIEHQQLRWFRTTLLGRTPGWSPPAAAVGPWRAIRIERRQGVAVEDVRLQARVAGEVGLLDVSCGLRALRGPVGPVELVVTRGGSEHRGPLTEVSGGGHSGLSLPAAGIGRYAGRVEVPGVARWWPHTHGEPALYQMRLIAGTREVDLGTVGFRELALDTDGGDFALRVNGAPVFCRGACWTPLDPVALTADRAAYAAALAQARDAGMNMLRVSGTMVYESDEFYDLADELGILIWQDFMFANQDYPEDPAFVDSVTEEARQVLLRLQGRPSLAVLCGNSEGEQQAAMWGAPRERWRARLFDETLARLACSGCPDVPYWPSSAHGGAFPHQGSAGSASYYGVGAYLRPLGDARRAEVRFASECLAFANVPAARTIDLLGPLVRVHHPAWKARTPRDLGAGWDFDDVRDHYLAQLFGVDPVALRYADHERYLALGRVVTGEVMTAVFGEWRRRGSTCRGGLVWFLRDLWAGAGWGVIDATGAPKAAYAYLRRALQPVAVHISDEGGNGLVVHVTNERPVPLAAELVLALYRAGEVVVGHGRRALELAPREAVEIAATSLFEGFIDLSYAYRFGPPPCDLVVATLTGGAQPAQAFHFPLGLPAGRELDLGLAAEARQRADGDLDLTVRTRRFAQSLALDVDGFAPDDDYFHLAPGGERTLRLRRIAGAGRPLRGSVQPLNAESATRIEVSA